jgi:CDP-4-dehydro-6-deoxyglucose reductase, E3
MPFFRGDAMSTETAPAKPKGRQIYKMRLTEIRDYTPQIRELFLTCEDPDSFQFRAGQFVMLHVPAEPKPLLRAYSIASDEARKDGYRLIFKYVENGAASQYVWGLKGGELLDFTGPFGRVFFKEPPTEQIVFLNTGSGVSQHFSFLESNLKKHPNLKYRMLFGVRYDQDIYYQEELERLKKQLPDFEYEYVLSRPSDSWKGKKGYVQNFIDAYGYLEIPTTFYLCGNGAMIKDVKAKLTAENFDPTRVWAEAFD